MKVYLVTKKNLATKEKEIIGIFDYKPNNFNTSIYEITEHKLSQDNGFRFFIVFFRSIKNQTGECRLEYYTAYPSNKEILEHITNKYSLPSTSHVSITNIIELNEQDYFNYIKE